MAKGRPRRFATYEDYLKDKNERQKAWYQANREKVCEKAREKYRQEKEHKSQED